MGKAWKAEEFLMHPESLEEYTGTLPREPVLELGASLLALLFGSQKSPAAFSFLLLEAKFPMPFRLRFKSIASLSSEITVSYIFKDSC